jgi:hypothetical protein
VRVRLHLPEQPGRQEGEGAVSAVITYRTAFFAMFCMLSKILSWLCPKQPG